MNILDALPVIGTFLAGPVGGLAGSAITFLAEKFGASEKTVDGIKNAISGMGPEELLRAKQIDIEFQKFCLENNIKVDLAQIAVNAEEAKSSNVFVAGWRPFVGWTCGVSLAYVSTVEPIARFVAQVGFAYLGPFPMIDTTITLQVLGGLLGIAGLRSLDKIKGVARV